MTSLVDKYLESARFAIAGGNDYSIGKAVALLEVLMDLAPEDIWRDLARAVEAKRTGDPERSTRPGCPFCGERATHFTKGEDAQGVFYTVLCEHCSAEGPGGRTEEDAMDFWTRAKVPGPWE